MRNDCAQEKKAECKLKPAKDMLTFTTWWKCRRPHSENLRASMCKLAPMFPATWI
jgi:hypothetical protein